MRPGTPANTESPMLDEHLLEWEEYDARLLDDTPLATPARSGLPSPRDIQRTSGEHRASFDGPFLLSHGSEALAEMESSAKPPVASKPAQFPTPSKPGGPKHPPVPSGCGCADSGGISGETEMATEAENLEEMELESRSKGALEEQLIDQANENEEVQRTDSLEFDPYSAIRPGLRPEHAALGEHELTVIVGRQPTLIALHQMLGSPQPQMAVLAALLGKTGRRSMKLDGTDVPIPAYLRRLSRMCREAAEQSEMEFPGGASGWEGAPQQEQQVAPSGGTKTIGASVGRKGVNHPDDVKLIQHLLNSNLPVPPAPLLENGIIDGGTISAIETYQKQILGSKTPDGRVDPKGRTFLSLAADKLSFLAHRCQPLAGASTSVDATVMDPGFLTSTGVTRDSGLQAIVERRVLKNHPKLGRLRFALVDLTGAAKLASPQFAGNRETEQGGLGSMAKLACMYAAYQLKFDLEELARQRSITDLKVLFDAARALWSDNQKPDPAHVTQLFPAGPKIELFGKLVAVDNKPLAGPRGLSMPNLERIFEKVPGSAGGLTIRFKGSDRILVDPSAAGPAAPSVTPEALAYALRGGANLREVRNLSFAERLFLMIDDSDNAAAHSCIEDIGFLFITSAIWQSDFYRPERGGGLWESSTHDKGGVRWLKPPVPRANPRADFVSATAASIAALMTLLEQNRLVNSDACAGMKQLTNKNKPGVPPSGSRTRSYFLEGLRPHLLPNRIHSKLGIGDFLNDCAIIVRTVPDPANPATSKEIRYVAAGFDDPTPATSAPAVFLNALIVELDKCIRENNGLLAAAAP